MGNPCEWFNKVPVGGPGQVVHNLDRSIVGGLHLLHLPATQVPELGPSIVRVINGVDLEQGLGVSKVEFLTQGVIFLNVLSILNSLIKLATINNIGNCVS